MTETVLPPEQCATMGEVRAGVDAIDRELVALLTRRYGYMKAAARIKTERGAVRDETRKAAVIAAAVRQADANDLPTSDIADLWDRLVESSIRYELTEWDRLRT